MVVGTLEDTSNNCLTRDQISVPVKPEVIDTVHPIDNNNIDSHGYP